MSKRTVIGILVGASLLLLAYHALQQVKRVSAAYVFGYPLLLMHKTRDATLVDPAGVNRFTHGQVFPDHTFRNVVRPNNDTLYSIAWLDLSGEAQVLSVPDTDGRYYVMPLMDAWTNVFAMVGKRTTGTGPGAFLIAGPDWRGQVPPDLTRIDAPTNMVWLIGRIQTNGKQDIPAVAELQRQFTLASLSQWQRGETRAPIVVKPDEVDVSSDPYAELAAMPAREFLSSLGLLMGEQSPSAEDGPALEQLAAIGVLPGKPYWGGALGILDAYLSNLAMGITRDEIRRQLDEGRPLENGWAVARDSIGVYGTDYGVRAGVAMIGLGALPPAEAAYPNTSADSEGRPLDGSYRYRLRFPPGETPPVEAFWSLTMYDQQGFLVDNPIRRYAIGDRDALEFAPDGSLDLWIQHEAPEGRESNWLPAPRGPFALTMRLYSPGERFLDGSWKLPAVERIESP